MACHHRLSAAYTVGRRRAWHAIIALGQQRRSDDVGRGIPSSPLDSTHGQTTSGVTCRHRLWTSHTVVNVGRGMTSPLLDSTHGRRHRTWHVITALGQHTRSDYVGRGMTSPPLDSTHGQTTSGVASHNRLWAAQTLERHRSWHAISTFGQHTRSNDVGRGMPSWPLDTTHDRTKSVVACHHSP